MTSIIFFFSSRRRHTRWPRDWSSDVCSSDLAAENAHRVHPDLPLAASLSEALDGSHVTVLLTEWEEFQAAQPEALGALVSRRRVLDARHALDGDRYLEAGWEYRTLGRPVTAAASPRGRSEPGPGEQEQLLPTAPAPSAQAAPLRL